MEKYVFESGLEAEFVSSRQNPRVVQTAKLEQKKYRDAEKVFLLDGVKLAHEALEFSVVKEVFLRQSDAEKLRPEATAAHEAGARVTVLSDAAFERITTENAPQGIVTLAVQRDIPEAAPELCRGRFTLMLDSVRDPGNLGTILRSASALGDPAVVLHSCADLWSRKTVRAAMGAVFKSSVSVTHDGASFVREARSAGLRVIASSPRAGGLTLGEFTPGENDVVIIGNEGHGVSDEIIAECDTTLLIPMRENVESLNASAAANVILWEAARRGK
ncbi:MAG: RNA methyltransferase [Clostridia bacterium]|nr:RNA methyltransferase [Clostridia bacterium]